MGHYSDIWPLRGGSKNTVFCIPQGGTSKSHFFDKKGLALGRFLALPPPGRGYLTPPLGGVYIPPPGGGVFDPPPEEPPQRAQTGPLGDSILNVQGAGADNKRPITTKKWLWARNVKKNFWPTHIQTPGYPEIPDCGFATCTWIATGDPMYS